MDTKMIMVLAHGHKNIGFSQQKIAPCVADNAVYNSRSQTMSVFVGFISFLLVAR